MFTKKERNIYSQREIKYRGKQTFWRWKKLDITACANPIKYYQLLRQYIRLPIHYLHNTVNFYQVMPETSLCDIGSLPASSNNYQQYYSCEHPRAKGPRLLPISFNVFYSLKCCLTVNTWKKATRLQDHVVQCWRFDLGVNIKKHGTRPQKFWPHFIA